MGLDKHSSLGSFEEMAEAQEATPEVKAVETEVATEVTTDNVETPKTE